MNITCFTFRNTASLTDAWFCLLPQSHSLHIYHSLCHPCTHIRLPPCLSPPAFFSSCHLLTNLTFVLSFILFFLRGKFVQEVHTDFPFFSELQAGSLSVMKEVSKMFFWLSTLNIQPHPAFFFSFNSDWTPAQQHLWCACSKCTCAHLGVLKMRSGQVLFKCYGRPKFLFPTNTWFFFLKAAIFRQ